MTGPSPTLELEVRPSELPSGSGPPLPFQRPVLVLRNPGGAPADPPELDLTVWQGETLLVEGSRAAGGLASGATAAWDLYDLLLEAAPGFASKVHMFGVKSLLNWSFRVRASARTAGFEETAAEFRFRWEQSGDEVVVRREG